MSGLVFNLIGNGADADPRPAASPTGRPGVTYVEGVSDLDLSTILEICRAISENTAITYKTSEIYYDREKMHRRISVGTQITIPLNGVDYVFDIIGFNHDDLSYPTSYGGTTATGKAGMTLQMHDLFATAYRMHSESLYGNVWENCEMRTQHMVTMKSYLPEDWKAVMKTVTKRTGYGQASTSGVTKTAEDCFLLAEREIGSTFDYSPTMESVSGEGNQYAYYQQDNPSRKKLSGVEKDYWTRSPVSGHASLFVVRGAGSGNLSDTPTSEYHIAFAFCI